MDRVAELLRDLRVRGDLTYEEAGKKAGVSKQAWHNWETGFNKINIVTLEKIAKGFNKTLVIDFK